MNDDQNEQTIDERPVCPDCDEWLTVANAGCANHDLRAALEYSAREIRRLRDDQHGASPGEIDRLRRIESGMVELGAPGGSTRDDPGGPMIAWAKGMRDALTKAEELLNRFLEGADAEPVEDGLEMSPGQLWERLLQSPADMRMEHLRRLVTMSDQGQRCYADDHHQRLSSWRDRSAEAHAKWAHLSLALGKLSGHLHSLDEVKTEYVVAMLRAIAEGATFEDAQRDRVVEARSWWAAGDPEPADGIDVLLDIGNRLDNGLPYLVRVSDGWVWCGDPKRHTSATGGMPWPGIVDMAVGRLIVPPTYAEWYERYESNYDASRDHGNDWQDAQIYAAEQTTAELGPEPDLQVVVDLLLLVGVRETVDTVSRWRVEQRRAAAEWAGAVHLDASDNEGVEIPARPDFFTQDNTGLRGV